MTIRIIKNSLILLGAAGALQGCHPVQQAPLVYSSKVTVGVDVTTPTTEQPAVAVNIGFKLLDLAYVPVAVAKPCDTDSPTAGDCTDDIYKLKPIVGKSNETEQTMDDPDNAASEIIANDQQGAEAAGDENDSLDETNSRDAAVAAKLKALNENIRQLKVDKATKQKQMQEAEKIAKEKTEEAQKKAAAAPNSTAANIASSQALEASRFASATSDEIATINKNIARKKSIQQALISNNNTTAKDAYSVFGSFDSGTKTEAKGTDAQANVDLKLGKVFSTGVAAQYLTRGLGKQFANNAASTCLASANAMIESYLNTYGKPTDDAGKQKFDKLLGAALAICGKTTNGS